MREAISMRSQKAISMRSQMHFERPSEERLGAWSTGAGRRSVGGMEHVMRETIGMHSDVQVAWSTTVALRDIRDTHSLSNRMHSHSPVEGCSARERP